MHTDDPRGLVWRAEEREITSTRNERVGELAQLAVTKHRRALGRYLIEGPHAVTEAVADGVVDEVFVTRGLLAELPGLVGDADVEVTLVSDHVMEKLADARAPQGVVAVGRMRTATLDEVVGRGLLVVAVAVNDPGNAGTIIRTADAAGATAVVLTTGSVDPFNPKSVRASTGSLTHLPIVTDVDAATVVAACIAAGQRTLALDANGGRDIEDAADGASVALFFGSETHGVPAEIAASVDEIVWITHHGRAESLNVAASVAIATFTIARRLHRTD